MKTMWNTLLLVIALLLVGAPSALGGTFPSSPWFGTNVQNQPDAASARNALGVPTGAHATNADNAGYATNAGHALVADALAGGINATQVTGLGALAGSNRVAWSLLDNVPGFGSAALVGTNQFVNTNAWYQFTNNAMPWASYYLASNPAGYQTAAQVASAAFNSTNGLPTAVWTLGTASQSNAAAFDLAGKAVAVTNGYPWGNLYDAAGKAQQATNGLPAGIWSLGNAAAADTNTMKVAASTNADYATASVYSTNAGGLIDSQNNGRVVISDTTTRIRDANGHSLFVATLGSPTSIRGPTNNTSQIAVDDFGVLIPTMEGNPVFSGNPTIAGGTLNFTNSAGLSGGSIGADSGEQSFSVYDANLVQRINISPNGDPNGLGGMWLNGTNGIAWIAELSGAGGVAFSDGASRIDTSGNFSGHAAYATNLLGTINYNQVTGAGTAGQSNAAAFDLAGKATAATNGLPAGVWTMGTASQSNASAFYLSSNPSGFISAVPSTYALKTDATNASLTEAQAATNGLPSGAFTAVGSSALLSSNTLLTEAGALIGGSNYQTAAQVSSASVAYATTAGNLTAINTNNINTNNASQLTSGTVALNLLPSGVVTNNSSTIITNTGGINFGGSVSLFPSAGYVQVGGAGLYLGGSGTINYSGSTIVLGNSASSIVTMNNVTSTKTTATNGYLTPLIGTNTFANIGSVTNTPFIYGASTNDAGVAYANPTIRMKAYGGVTNLIDADLTAGNIISSGSSTNAGSITTTGSNSRLTMWSGSGSAYGTTMYASAADAFTINVYSTFGTSGYRFYNGGYDGNLGGFVDPGYVQAGDYVQSSRGFVISSNTVNTVPPSGGYTVSTATLNTNYITLSGADATAANTSYTWNSFTNAYTNVNSFSIAYPTNSTLFVLVSNAAFNYRTNLNTNVAIYFATVQTNYSQGLVGKWTAGFFSNTITPVAAFAYTNVGALNFSYGVDGTNQVVPSLIVTNNGIIAPNITVPGSGTINAGQYFSVNNNGATVSGYGLQMSSSIYSPNYSQPGYGNFSLGALLTSTVYYNSSNANFAGKIIVTNGVTSFSLLTVTNTLPTIAQFNGSNSAWAEINVQNFAPAGSADLTATADNGTPLTNYINTGINGSKYVPGAGILGSTNDTYISSVGQNFFENVVGTGNRQIWTSQPSTNGTVTTNMTLSGSGLTLNTGTFTGNGSGLTNLPAAQLTGNVPLAALTNVFNGSTAVNGGGLTNLNPYFVNSITNIFPTLGITNVITATLSSVSYSIFSSAGVKTFSNQTNGTFTANGLVLAMNQASGGTGWNSATFLSNGHNLAGMQNGALSVARVFGPMGFGVGPAEHPENYDTTLLSPSPGIWNLSTNLTAMGTITATNGFIVPNGCIITNGVTIVLSNSWTAAAYVTNVMPNFSTAFHVSSNGFPVSIYMSNSVPFIYYETSAGGGILP